MAASIMMTTQMNMAGAPAAQPKALRKQEEAASRRASESAELERAGPVSARGEER